RQVQVEELAFVDSHYLGVFVDAADELARAPHALRRDAHIAMGDDAVVAVAVVEQRLEDLDLLPGNLRPSQPANELFALAAEHAAGDDFDPPVFGGFADDLHRGQTRP